MIFVEFQRGEDHFFLIFHDLPSEPFHLLLSCCACETLASEVRAKRQACQKERRSTEQRAPWLSNMGFPCLGTCVLHVAFVGMNRFVHLWLRRKESPGSQPAGRLGNRFVDTNPCRKLGWVDWLRKNGKRDNNTGFTVFCRCSQNYQGSMQLLLLP